MERYAEVRCERFAKARREVLTLRDEEFFEANSRAA